MTNKVRAVLCLAVLSTTMAAQSEPILVSANIPSYPPLALQARIEGIVKLTFILGPNAAEPMKIQVESSHAALKGAAVENVKTSRFQNPYAVERRYETVLDYRLLSSGPQRVTFESFNRVEILRFAPMHSD
jgi:Gram-negative bacterial TonB protein C-terminal